MLCLLSVLCVRISTLKAQEDQINKCFAYYEQIVEIQEQRTMFQHGLEQIIDLFADGKLSKKEVDRSIALWHTVESKLKREVTSLYDTAYAEGCFDESLGTKTRDAPEI